MRKLNLASPMSFVMVICCLVGPFAKTTSAQNNTGNNTVVVSKFKNVREALAAAKQAPTEDEQMQIINAISAVPLVTPEGVQALHNEMRNAEKEYKLRGQ